MTLTPWVSHRPPHRQCPKGGRRCGHQDAMTTSPVSPDHRGRTLEIPGHSDPNIIPDTDESSHVRVTGGSVLQSLPSGHPQTHVTPADPYLIP